MLAGKNYIATPDRNHHPKSSCHEADAHKCSDEEAGNCSSAL
jgi:hypothetical protein